jgi:glycosyltransferase involved in cell wall biosynthesis
MAARVLHIVRGSTFYGGPDLYTLNTFRSLEGMDHELFLAVLTKDSPDRVPLCREAEDRRLPHCFIDARSGFRPYYVRRLKELIRTERIDIVHTHEYKSDLVGLLAARASGIPAAATAHGWTRNSLRAVVYEHLEGRLLRRFDRVLTGSRFMVEDLRRLGIRPERILHIPNAVDTERFSRKEPSRREARQSWNMPEEDLVVGTIGRLTGEKGHRSLLQAFVEVHKRMPGVRLVFLGDGEDRGALFRLARRLGIEDAVRWIPGCPHERIPAFLRCLDAFVLPSLRENQPLALLEAMAAGIPVVATDVGGVGEIIRDGEEGLLVRPGDRDALVEALVRILGSGESSQRVQRALNTVSGRFSLDRFARDVGRVYSDLAATSRS